MLFNKFGIFNNTALYIAAVFFGTQFYVILNLCIGIGTAFRSDSSFSF